MRRITLAEGAVAGAATRQRRIPVWNVSNRSERASRADARGILRDVRGAWRTVNVAVNDRVSKASDPLMRVNSWRPYGLWREVTWICVAALLCTVLAGCGPTRASPTAQPVSAAAPTVPSTAGKLATGTVLQNSSLYPRVVRIEHGPAAQDGELIASTNGRIFMSANDGQTFTYLDTVPTINGSAEYCCGTLFEMPKTVGSLTAGTLLFAATYYVGASRAIEVYRSTNDGITWAYSSTPVSGGSSTHGLWEPEFSVAANGALVMFWSDETDPCCSQKLAQIRTFDGTEWQDETNTVASNDPADRPGMAVVTKLPSGIYFMSYELCGPSACAVYGRTSTNGWNYGNPSNLGDEIRTVGGQYFEHAPTNVWSPSALSANGALLLVGQVLHDADGSVSSENGKVLFMTTSPDGSGPWYPIDAPVQVPTAYNNYCPNYSSALLPSPEGRHILELASDYNDASRCVTYFATETWNAQPTSGESFAVVNQKSNLCLAAQGGGSASGAAADYAHCSGLAGQQWQVQSVGRGYFSVRNVYSGLCLDDSGGSTAGENSVILSICDGSEAQAWQFLNVGEAVYSLLNEMSAGATLGSAGGAIDAGMDVQMSVDDGSQRDNWTLN